MLRSIVLAAVSFISLSVNSGAFELGSVTYGTLPPAAAPVPGYPSPVTPPGVTIANYTTDETFTFESQAKPALDARVAALQAAGVSTLGGRVVPAGNDYSFVIDYIPTVKAGAALPPAVLVGTYRNGAAYWREQDARAAMQACAANFRSAKIAVLGSYLEEAGNDDAFAVDYLQKNLLRPTQEYAVKFERYTGGKYTFESEAVKAVPSYLALFKQSGVPAIRGKAVQRPDGDYAVQVEFVVKTNNYGPRPQYSVARYDARAEFPFEKDAQAAGQAALPGFAAAGAPPLSSVVRPVDRDYSYSVDFLVANIYQPGGVVPSIAIQTYQAAETYTFDSEAKKAMQEKVAAFNAGGLPVVGSAVTGELGSFTYVLDYVAKAGQGGPAYPPPPQY